MRVRSIVVAAVLLTSLAVTPMAWAGKKLPDLAPTVGGVDQGYAFIGGRLKMEATDTTINVGKARAAGSVTTFYLSKKDPKARRELTTRKVGALKPGEADSGSERADGRNDFPAGAYRIVACVDAKDKVKESDEGNNCGKVVSPKRFYSAYEEWEGSLSGTAPGVLTPDAKEKWESTDVSFGSPSVAGGIFQYPVTGGAITYTFSGTTQTGCGTYSGGGTFALDRNFGLLTIDYDGENYNAGAGATLGSQYPITSACGPGAWGAHEPALETGETKLKDGASTLKGAAADPSQGANYKWELEGR